MEKHTNHAIYKLKPCQSDTEVYALFIKVCEQKIYSKWRLYFLGTSDDFHSEFLWDYSEDCEYGLYEAPGFRNSEEIRMYLSRLVAESEILLSRDLNEMDIYGFAYRDAKEKMLNYENMEWLGNGLCSFQTFSSIKAVGLMACAFLEVKDRFNGLWWKALPHMLNKNELLSNLAFHTKLVSRELS